MLSNFLFSLLFIHMHYLKFNLCWLLYNITSILGIGLKVSRKPMIVYKYISPGIKDQGLINKIVFLGYMRHL